MFVVSITNFNNYEWTNLNIAQQIGLALKNYTIFWCWRILWSALLEQHVNSLMVIMQLSFPNRSMSFSAA